MGGGRDGDARLPADCFFPCPWCAPLQSRCDCSSQTNECARGQYCWADYSCRDEGLVECEANNESPLDRACRCAVTSTENECPAGGYCWATGRECADRALQDCTKADTLELQEACVCGSDVVPPVVCSAGSYCWSSGTCAREPSLSSCPHAQHAAGE